MDVYRRRMRDGLEDKENERAGFKCLVVFLWPGLLDMERVKDGGQKERIEEIRAITS